MVLSNCAFHVPNKGFFPPKSACSREASLGWSEIVSPRSKLRVEKLRLMLQHMEEKHGVEDDKIAAEYPPGHLARTTMCIPLAASNGRKWLAL